MDARSMEAGEFAATRQPLPRASTLPPRCYTDPAFYRQEVERIFRREWLSVGRVEQVARRGDYFTIDLLDEPLVVVRDKDDAVRVMSRVCRHRWMPVVDGTGNRQSFQCPYHLWTYGLDGRLLGAPEMHGAEDFDKTQCRLPALRTAIWEGWIFVNFDAGAAPLAPQIEPLRQAIAAYRLPEMRAMPPLVYDSRWNWKVMVENFMESYHHMGPHADTLQPVVPAAGTYAADAAGPYAILHNPAKDRSLPLAMLAPIAGLSAEQRSEFLVCAVFPFHLFAVNPDSLIYYQMQPHGVEHFTLRIHLCVSPAAVGDPAVEQLRGFVDTVHQQDIVACTGVQAGLRSRLAAQGRYSHLEKALWQLHQFVLARVAGDAP
jgi:phenylpropionate dioxygenase-like ring-hydroxylating dioxygenase large terminal subunit